MILNDFTILLLVSGIETEIHEIAPGSVNNRFIDTKFKATHDSLHVIMNLFMSQFLGQKETKLVHYKPGIYISLM